MSVKKKKTAKKKTTKTKSVKKMKLNLAPLERFTKVQY